MIKCEEIRSLRIFEIIRIITVLLHTLRSQLHIRHLSTRELAAMNGILIKRFSFSTALQ